MGDKLIVGEYYKVNLPGETPWAECLAVHEDETWGGRIANRLFAEMAGSERDAIWPAPPGEEALPSLHNYQQDMVVRFLRIERSGFMIWVPVDLPGGSA